MSTTLRCIVVQPDETITVRHVANDLAALQEIVGGYIELVRLTCEFPATAYINEEGKIHGLPANPAASFIASLRPGDYIAGTMVILGPPDAGGNDTDVSDAVISWLRFRYPLQEGLVTGPPAFLPPEDELPGPNV
jgi:hypothetical protein